MTETKNMTIPSDWEILHLGEIFKLTSGKTKPSELFDEHVDEYIYPVYGGNGIIGFAKEFNSEGENILIGRVGEYCGITRFLNEKCWITDNALYSKDFLIDIDAKFLVYKLQLDDLSKLRNKGGQPLISQGPISLNKVCIPRSLPEQKAIARVLSTWDEAIHKTEQLIAQKELRKKWLMQNLLTGKMRLKGFDGEWEDIELGELLNYEQPTKYLVKDTLYSNLYSIPVLTAGKTFILGYTNEENDICDDLPVVIFDDFTTASKYVDFPFKAKSSAMKLLRPKQNVNLKFVFEAMKLINYVVGNHERHWISKFVYLTIPCPFIDEQTAIAEVLQAADKEISLLKAKVEKLKEQKKGLMQVLLTGKKRLKA